MNYAIQLAERGLGLVNPNPLVGAVIIKNGRIIGKGWHERFGGPHAERNALSNCTEDPAGAMMYVTLEPCCHFGKTPPCTEAIIQSGIRKVLVGIPDPNPLVAGQGIERLREAGIQVVVGLCEQEIREQNRVFLKYITTGRPWVVMKTAMTLDGKIATSTGDSRWVTGVKSRKMVQEMRRTYMSVMVGIGTVEADNPMLNYRQKGDVRQPLRIVVDSRGRIAVGKKLIRSAHDFPVMIAHTAKADPSYVEVLNTYGMKSVCCAERDGHVDIGDMLRQLGEQGIDSVLLEGGGILNEAFLRGGFVDEVYAFVAPKFVGGKDAKTPVEGGGIEKMNEAICLSEVRTERIGDDILIRGLIK